MVVLSRPVGTESHWVNIAIAGVMYVPNLFLTTFPKAPPFSSHYCCPNFNFHIYITRRREGHIGKQDKAFFHFGERFYVWECPIFENIGDGRSNDSF
jgi:hypothetical protein